MKQDKKPRIIRTRDPPHRGKCPECDTQMKWKCSATWKCPKCGMMVKRIPHYGKYPEMKHQEYDACVPAKYYRIDPSVKHLKPIKRVTKVKGKEYVHYVISTTIPEKWKHGVEVTIKPISPETSVKELRRNERDMNERGPYYREQVEEYWEKLDSEGDRDYERDRKGQERKDQ